MATWLDFARAPDWQPQLAVAYAMLLGGAIGYERERKGRPAGLRTHMLIAGTAALLVGLGDVIATRYAASYAPGLLRMDPFRLIEAVVAAVGFIGAGEIFRGGRHGIGGLTTAASMLTVSGIGIAVGLRAWWLALGATLLALVVLWLFARLERAMETRDG